MDVVDRLNRRRRELVEHGEVDRVEQLDEDLLRHWNPRILLRDVRSARCGRRHRCGAGVERVVAVGRPVGVAVLGEALRDQLRADLAQMVQRGLLDEAELLVEREHQRGHHRQPVLSSDFVHLRHGPPRDLLVAVLLPSFKVTGVKVFLLVVDRRLSKHRHAVRHRLHRALLAAHFDVVRAQEQRLHAADVLLLAHRHRIQVQVDEVGEELQREAFQLVLVGSVEVVELDADRVEKLKKIFAANCEGSN